MKYTTFAKKGVTFLYLFTPFQSSLSKDTPALPTWMLKESRIRMSSSFPCETT